MERITGKVLAETIVNSLATWGLSLSNMRGQCYDGASNMAGARSGCGATVRQAAVMALYHQCASHRLNLAVLSACKITATRNTESYIGEMARFFWIFCKTTTPSRKSNNYVISSSACKKTERYL